MSRGRFTFWLDYRKDDELLLAEMIDELKKKRSFSKAIRDGVRLIYDLRAGKIDVLLELFPWVKDALGEPHKKAISQSELMLQFERLEKLLLEQKRPLDAAPKSLTSGTLRTLSAPKFDDDDDDDLWSVKRGDQDATQNFLKNMSLFG